LRGSPIKLDSGELLKDKQNHIVISKLNSQIYKLGEVIKFSSPKETSDAIELWIEKQSISKDIERKSSSYIELFFIPTFLALVLIFLSSTRYIKRFIWLLALLGMNLEAYDIFDSFYLHQAYIEYQNAEYNSSLDSISNIETKSLESELIRANIHYRLQHYKVAKSIWSSIKTTNPKIKQQILYNLGNCEAKMAYYSKAIDYYIKALAFGEDEDILHNLEVVIFQRDKYNSKLGTTNPKSAQKSSSGSNDNSKRKKEKSKSSKQGSSSGDSSSKSSKISTTAIKPSQTDNQSKKEMSSKAYELINEGYINEERPW
jgi:Ca-activated chloride channel family protein